MLKSTLAPLINVVAGINEIKTELKGLNTSVSQFSAKIQDLEERVGKIESAQEEICQLKTRIVALEDDLNEKNQWMRLNNVEIKGVPLKDRENLLDIVSKLGTKIMCPVSKSNINFVARVPSRESGNSRTKPIIVSFLNRYLKEDFVAAARSMKTLCPADIDLEGTNRIYINDHLTVQNKILLSKVKTLAK